MLYFSSLSQIPSSPLPLPISFFPPYFTFLLPLCFFFLCNPQWSRGTHFLALSLQRRSTLQPCTFPYLCSSFFFSCIIFHFFFLCLQPLPVPRLVFCMTRIFLLPSPTFTWGTWEQMTSLAVSVLSQISPWGDLVSPQSRTEVLRRLVDRNWRMLLTWCRSSALLRLERSHGAV